MVTSGRLTIDDVTPEVLWAELRTPERFAAALPSVSGIERDRSTVKASVEPATSLGTTPFELEFELSEHEQAAALGVRGTGRGPEYEVEFDFDLRLVAEGDGTGVEWRGDVEIAGPLASVGQRILPAVLSEQVAETVRAAAEASSQAPT